MLLVLALAAGLWAIGHLMKAPKQARWLMIGLLYVAVLGVHIVLPDGHPLRENTGQSAAFWLILGGAGVLVFFYRKGLSALRAQSQSATDTSQTNTGTFSEVELDRYARHIVLREIGGPGQKVLKSAKVLVIGAGGLGAPALIYLAAAGVGRLGVIDDDVVENANLQRQIIHADAAIGTPKVFSAQDTLLAQNPYVDVRPYHRRLTEDIAADLFADYDLILDGTDNFDTRYLVNRTAVQLGKPVISGALSQWEGQISVFHPASGGPCYQCIFSEAPAAGLAPSCAEAGVIGPLPGVVGAMMAMEALKYLTGAGQTLQGQMLFYDGLYGTHRTVTLKPRADCPVCQKPV
jgi:molybdopterin/thiamine biosynthesis adenylyltransferase